MTWFQTFAVGILVLFVGWATREIWSTLPTWWDRRREAKAARDKEEARVTGETRLKSLREEVRRAAERDGSDLPWSYDRSWQGPGVCVVNQSGERSYFIHPYSHGIGQYERAVRQGKVPPGRTFERRPPKPVISWSEQELREWLRTKTQQE